MAFDVWTVGYGWVGMMDGCDRRVRWMDGWVGG